MFKKHRNKSKGKGKRSKIQSSISKKLQNQTRENDDITSNISQIGENNQNLLGSLILMQEELQKERLKSQISKSPFSKKNISTVIIKDGKKKKLTLSQIAKEGEKNNSFINSRSSQIKPIKTPKRMKKSELFKESDKKGENKYYDEKELILLVITLKKTLIHHRKKNQVLKEQKKKLKEKNLKILKSINKSEDKIANLERKQRIEDRVVYNLDFDLDKLDKDYLVMDDNIKASTGFNSQEPFIIKTAEFKEKLRRDMTVNEKSLHLLTKNMSNLNSALKKLNNQ